MVPLKLTRLGDATRRVRGTFMTVVYTWCFPPFTEQLYVMTLALNLTFSTTFGIGLYSLNLLL